MQYYGILEDRKTAAFTATTEKAVIAFAKKHPEAGIVFVADRFRILYDIPEDKGGGVS